MPISEPFRRGYRRATQDASNFAFQRKIHCEEAADKYAREKPDDPYWQNSERCAAREAGFIWEEILKLKPHEDRDTLIPPHGLTIIGLSTAIHDALELLADTDLSAEDRAANAQMCLSMSLNRLERGNPLSPANPA